MVPTLLSRSIGSHLLGENGATVPLSTITVPNKIIGLYFAAKWSPMCKSTTELLIGLKNQLQDSAKWDLQLILVSGDEDETTFKEHFEGMPWFAVPYTETRRRIRLTRLHRVTTFPFLVFVEGSTGRTISRIGSEVLARDPKGIKFPWKPRSLKEILTEAKLVDPNGVPVKFEEEGYKGLYFSANWCPPCKAFTPQLISTYERIRSNGIQFQVIFISSDRSEESWKGYHSTMPWPGIDWKDSAIRDELADQLEVRGIPTLYLLDTDYSIISREGRSLVNHDPEAIEFPWRPQSVELLRDYHMPSILEQPCLILFTDDEPSEVQFGVDVLLPIAEDYLSDEDATSSPLLLFYVAGEDDVCDRLREAANLEDVVPLLTILDLAEGTKYVLEEGVEISNVTVHNFVRRYINEELNPTAIMSYTDPSLIDKAPSPLPSEDKLVAVETHT